LWDDSVEIRRIEGFVPLQQLLVDVDSRSRRIRHRPSDQRQMFVRMAPTEPSFFARKFATNTGLTHSLINAVEIVEKSTEVVQPAS
jgi:hypothetical protein